MTCQFAGVTLLFYFVLILSTNLFVLSSPCFITNCPPGGKRSGNTLNELKQCTSCGSPKFNGQCYGSNICCSKEFGCLIGTSETEKCKLENLLSIPCDNFGKSCSGYDKNQPINGHCAADGICCNTELCSMDSSCRIEEKGIKTFPARHLLQEFQTPNLEKDLLSYEDSNPNNHPVIFLPTDYPTDDNSNIIQQHLLPETSEEESLEKFWADFLPINQKRSTTHNKKTNQSKFPLLKLSRPGWNVIVRKILQIDRRNGLNGKFGNPSSKDPRQH